MTVYCFDSSALIEAWTRYYPQDVLPSFWQKLDELIKAKRMFVCEEVVREVEQQDDGLPDWIRARPEMIVPLDEATQIAGKEILANHSALIDVKRLRSMADPWVIAAAKVRGASVVTQESVGTPAKPKIPYVCNATNVKCVKLIDVIRAEKWRF